MHGLINRSLENFLRHTYGDDIWRALIERLDLGYDSFEPMFQYRDADTQALIDAAAASLDKPQATLLEDFGTSLIADPRNERVRRLLRFGGVDYVDFLHSLDDLPGRARLAVPDLDLPVLELRDKSAGDFFLTCQSGYDGYGHVILGVLRALADDYGALVFLEHLGRRDGVETLSIRLLDACFAKGRSFSLAAKAV